MVRKRAFGERWEDDSVQFPKLLSVIGLVGSLSDEQYEALIKETGLTRSGINDIFERAHLKWEELKRGLSNG